MPNGAASMNEGTIEFIMRAFSILICLVIGIGMLTLCLIIVRDGSDPLVSQALDDIKIICIGGFSSIVVMVTGRSIVSNTIQRGLNQVSASNVQPASNGVGPVAPVPNETTAA